MVSFVLSWEPGKSVLAGLAPGTVDGSLDLECSRIWDGICSLAT